MSRRAGVLGAVAVIAVVALGISNASAASLSVIAGKLGTFNVADRCATAPLSVTVAGTPTGGNYTQVSISSVPALCANLKIQLTLVGASGASIVEFLGAVPAITAPTPVTLTLPALANYSGAAVIGAALTIGRYGVTATWTAPPAPPAGTCVVTGYQPGSPSEHAPMLTGGTQTCSVTSVTVVKKPWIDNDGAHHTQFNVTLHNNSTDTIAFELDANLATSPPYLTWEPKSLDLSNLSLVSACGSMPNVRLTGPTGNFWNSIIKPGEDRVLDFIAVEDTSGATC
jgi:hypothetical protein